MTTETEMFHSHKYDAVIIGAGAAGSVFAYELTRAGWHVLALERGQHYREHRQAFTESELGMWPLLWDNSLYEVEGDGFHRTPNLGQGVGGGTLAWTAVSLRLFERDLRFRSHYGRPAGSSVEDWPLSLQELEPWYERAELQMGVSGAPTPWDEPGRRPLPNPPLCRYPSSELLSAGMERLGLRSAPCPVAINSQPYQGRSGCLHCGFCRSGCRVDAKYQADRVLIAPALQTGRLELCTQVQVTRIDMSRHRRRVEGVTYVDTRTGRQHRARARTVIACNNPLEIPRLLLASAHGAHPQGLGNQHEQVGRHFFCHLGTIGMGITAREAGTSAGHNMGNLMSLDCAESRPEQPYRGGFSLIALNGAGAGVMAVDPLRRFLGAELKQRMAAYNRSLLLVSFGEGLPSAENRITLDGSKRDGWGMPVARVHYTLLENDRRLFSAATEKMAQVLRASGAHEVQVTAPPFEAHPMGTMRMGNDPRTSATDVYGRVHGLDNLFVGGAALYPTGGCANPTLTLHALALRTADHLTRCQ